MSCEARSAATASDPPPAPAATGLCPPAGAAPGSGAERRRGGGAGVWTGRAEEVSSRPEKGCGEPPVRPAREGRWRQSLFGAKVLHALRRSGVLSTPGRDPPVTPGNPGGWDCLLPQLSLPELLGVPAGGPFVQPRGLEPMARGWEVSKG